MFFLTRPSAVLHRREREKVPDKEKDSDPDVDEPVSEAELSLMDCTKRHARAAHDQHKKKTSSLLSTEEEVLDLEEVLLQTRERVQATKAARARTANLRRQLEELQEEEEEAVQDSDPDPVQPSATDPTDVAALVAASLKIAVSFISLLLFTADNVNNID